MDGGNPPTVESDEPSRTVSVSPRIQNNESSSTRLLSKIHSPFKSDLHVVSEKHLHSIASNSLQTQHIAEWALMYQLASRRRSQGLMVINTFSSSVPSPPSSSVSQFTIPRQKKTSPRLDH